MAQNQEDIPKTECAASRAAEVAATWRRFRVRFKSVYHLTQLREMIESCLYRSGFCPAMLGGGGLCHLQVKSGHAVCKYINDTNR